MAIWLSDVGVVVYDFIVRKSSDYVSCRLIFVEFRFLYECGLWVIVLCM